MAEDSMALLDTLRKSTEDGDVDVLREGVRILAQALMETGVTGVTKGERDPEHRLTRRNGYRDPPEIQWMALGGCTEGHFPSSGVTRLPVW